MYDVKPQGAGPFHAALLQKQDDSIGRGYEVLDHLLNLLRSTIALPILSLKDEARGVDDRQIRTISELSAHHNWLRGHHRTPQLL